MKIIALVLAVMTVLGLTTAFADVTITVNRDKSDEDTATGDRTYTWYRPFTALIPATLPQLLRMQALMQTVLLWLSPELLPRHSTRPQQAPLTGR